ncbi:hypothetical protein MD484_g5721, partial [Candolleomyces efflorescens]
MCNRRPCVCYWYNPQFNTAQVRHLEENTPDFDRAMESGHGNLWVQNFLNGWIKRWPVRKGGNTLTARIAYERRLSNVLQKVEAECLIRLFCHKKDMTREELAVWMGTKIIEVIRDMERVKREERELEEARAAADLFETGSNSGDEDGENDGDDGDDGGNEEDEDEEGGGEDDSDGSEGEEEGEESQEFDDLLSSELDY